MQQHTEISTTEINYGPETPPPGIQAIHAVTTTRIQTRPWTPVMTEDEILDWEAAIEREMRWEQ